MRYLITYVDGKLNPFYTNVYDYENNYTDNMIVYDLLNNEFTPNGTTWIKIEFDNL